MSPWAIWIGIALGVVILLISLRQRIVQTRTFLFLTLTAIALFYPVFELYSGPNSHTSDAESFSAPHHVTAHLHLTGHFIVVGVFLAVSFWGLAKRSSQMAFTVLAALILGHSLFDAIIFIFMPLSNSGPVWWPEFCAAVDITLGLGLLSVRKRVSA